MVQFKSNILPLMEEIERLKFENSQLREKIVPDSNSFMNSNNQQISFVEQLQVAIIFTDSAGLILKCNRKVEDLIGLKKSEITGQFIHKIYSKLNRTNEYLPKAISNFLKDDGNKSAKFTIQTKLNSDIKYIDINVSKIIENEEIQYCFILTDITENHETFQFINKKFEESTIQLKEIHHRIKNNLQLISSFLNMEYSRHKLDKNLSVESILKESQNKIQSISLIHKNLYENDELSSIEIGEYICQLFCYISKLYNTENKQIKLEMNDEIHQLPLKESISLGLLIDEIITNSFKHAFNNQLTGIISINLNQVDNQINLKISDTGSGFTNYDKSKNKKSFGLELIHTLIKQLRGNITINSEVGTEYQIRFPI